MRALVIDGPGSISLRKLPERAAENECRIRVSMAGICGTDLQLLQGYADFRGTPGHEFVGVVEWAPPGEDHWIGRRVVGEINVGCGACEWCRTGAREHCPARTVVGIRGRDGAFAEWLSLPAGNLHAVPDGMDDETAVFVEPVAAGCRILQQLEIQQATRIAVLGDGRMGLLVAQVLRTAADDVVLLGRHHEKLDAGASVGLAVALLDAESPSVAYDVVVDVTGRSEGLQHALRLVRPRGTVVMKSTFHGESRLASWPLVVHEIALVGSRCGPFAPALAMLASGRVQVRPLISAIVGLDDYESAFDRARRTVKVLFDVGGSSARAVS